METRRGPIPASERQNMLKNVDGLDNNLRKRASVTSSCLSYYNGSSPSKASLILECCNNVLASPFRRMVPT